MKSQEYKNLVEAYQKVYEQQIGVPLSSPTDSAAAKKLGEIIQKQGLGKPSDVVIPKSGLQKAHYELDGDVLEEDENFYDFVLNRLIEEGNTREESLEMMVNINENRLRLLKQASQMWKMMANPKSIPIKPPSGPTNLTSIFRGSTPLPAKPPAKFQIGTPPKPVTPPASVNNLTSLPTSAKATVAASTAVPSTVAVTQSKTTVPQSSSISDKPYSSPFAGNRDTAFTKASQIKGSPVLGPKIIGPKNKSKVDMKAGVKPVSKPQPPSSQSQNVTPGGVKYERRAATRAELDAARDARSRGEGEEGAIKAAVQVKKSNK